MFSPEFFQRKNTSIHVTGKLCTHFIMSLKKCALTICFKGALKNWTRFQQVKLYIFIIYGVFISLFIDVYNIDQRIEADHYCWKISSKYRIRNQPPPPLKKWGATNALYKYTDLIKFLGKQRLLFVQKLCFPIIFWLFWWRNESHGILVSVKHSSEGKKQMVLYTLCNKPQRRRNNL